MHRKLIANGLETSYSTFPFVVQVFDETMFAFCGGTILDASSVLTAAHCVTNAVIDGTPLYVGQDEDGSPPPSPVSDIISHPMYNHSNTSAILYGNDVALLKFDTPLSFGEALPVLESIWTMDLPSGYVFGHGSQYLYGPASPVLRFAPVRPRSTLSCRKLLRFDLVESNACAGDIATLFDSCTGDSGGPLATAFEGQLYLIGVVSWGVGECGFMPGIYTKTDNVVPFLNAHSSATVKQFTAAFDRNCQCTTTCESNAFPVDPECGKCIEGACYTSGSCLHGSPSQRHVGAIWSACSMGPVQLGGDQPATPPPPPSEHSWSQRNSAIIVVIAVVASVLFLASTAFSILYCRSCNILWN